MSSAPVGPRAAWHVLSSRDFGLYFWGNAASASGSWFHNPLSQFAAILLLSP